MKLLLVFFFGGACGFIFVSFCEGIYKWVGNKFKLVNEDWKKVVEEFPPKEK